MGTPVEGWMLREDVVREVARDLAAAIKQYADDVTGALREAR
jgi:hypothetical protein